MIISHHSLLLASSHSDRENLIDQTRILSDLNQDLMKKLNEKAGATFQVKSQKTPAKPKKTPPRAQFARTPAPVSNLYPSTPAPATSPREDID
jgi:hypothetical protein